MEGRDGGIESVDTSFDTGNFVGVETAGFAQLGEGGVGGQIGADDKEFVLYEEQEGVVVGVIPGLA